MKITVTKEQLLNGLQAVQNVVSSRTTLPVLSNVLLRAEGEQLELTATDLDVTIVSSVSSSVETPGSTTLPAKKLVGIIRELNSPEIDIEVDEKNLCSLRAGSSFYKINGLAAEEFPPQPKFEEKKKVALPQEKLKLMLRRTSYAASMDETRYVLNGILCSLKENKITLVATDGRRMAMTDDDIEIPEESEGDFIIPTKAINELNRLLQGSGEVEAKFTESQAAFTLNEENSQPVLIISKLIDGTYPNYRQVIPKETKERVTLDREEFLHALRRAEIMTSEKTNSVKLNFSANNLTITANTPEVGEAHESIAINYQGEEIAVAFNPTYLMDPLKVLDNDEIYFEMTDELSPGVLKISGAFIYVIMPMRMN